MAVEPITPPARAYVVCATQRSGSTLLCELLAGTGVAGTPREYFEAEHDTGVPPHPGSYLDGLPRTGAGVRDDPTPTDAPPYSSLRGIGDYREHLARTYAAGTTANGVFATKLMFNQLPELQALCAGVAELEGLDLDALLSRLFGADAVYVWVHRRDTVRQAVSLWTAMQTRRWRGGGSGAAGGSAPREPEYRFAAVDHLVTLLRDGEAGWREHFTRRGIEPLQFVYEDDLAGDPAGAVDAVLTRIGVAAPAGWAPEARMARQADGRSEEWVRRYHREVA